MKDKKIQKSKINFRCNLQGTCCYIPSNDTQHYFPIYPSDILRLVDISKTTFHLFQDKMDIQIFNNKQFIAYFKPKQHTNKKYFECPYFNMSKNNGQCRIYDYRPIRCKLYPYTPPSTKNITDWLEPIEKWIPNYGICNNCLKQFETTSNIKINTTMSIQEWAEYNNININEINAEFTALKEIFHEIKTLDFEDDAILRIAIEAYHLDLATTARKNLLNYPDLIEQSIDLIIANRPQTVKELYKNIKELINIEKIKKIKKQKSNLIYQ